MKGKTIILIGLIFVATAIANADFGQSAGVLDFGEITLGENKTLTYWLVNTGNEPIEFEIITYSGNIVVEPTNGTILPHSQQEMKVTAIANETGNFSGKITARALQNVTGTIVFNVELEKNYKFEVIKKQEFPSKWLFFGGIVIFLIFLSIYYYKLKGGKKRWMRK
ncbi:MAG: DUF1573 domain-containing protein [Nanoarchaeota archaeon]|nr:DUF1573 domain-containing protein [Nanoarchaeota archaeon]